MLRLRTGTFHPLLFISLQEELQRKIQLRGILQNLKTLNTKSSTIRDDAKARSKNFLYIHKLFLSFITVSLPYFAHPPLLIFPLYLSEKQCVPGKVEDLTDLLLEDWQKLGNCREIGEATLRFIRTEMERSWGDKKLAVFDEAEAQKVGSRGKKTFYQNYHFETGPPKLQVRDTSSNLLIRTLVSIFSQCGCFVCQRRLSLGRRPSE